VVQDVPVFNWTSGGRSTMVVCPPGDADVESAICCLLEEQEQNQEQESDP
jgi:hypothetical protein